jgi:hypothetical protein
LFFICYSTLLLKLLTAALGIAFGSSAGIILGSLGFFSVAKETLSWDAEMEGEKV